MRASPALNKTHEWRVYSRLLLRCDDASLVLVRCISLLRRRECNHS